MPDAPARIAVVTGATSGIGRVTAERLAQQGWTVLCIGRDPQRGHDAVNAIRQATGNRHVDFLQADLSSIAATKAIGAMILDRHRKIDLLINNAGALFSRRRQSVDGLEMTFALNHLGYFVLTSLLLDALRAAPGARIVNVASRAHEGATLDFDDLQMEHRRYSGWVAYQRSKLANILFTRELARRLGAGPPIANSLHPGFVASRFGSNNGPFWYLFLRIAQKVAAISSETAAEGLLHLALAPALATTTGAYFDRTQPATPAPAALDDKSARRLWSISADLARLD
jgi:retinol dehydrogenase-12